MPGRGSFPPRNMPARGPRRMGRCFLPAIFMRAPQILRLDARCQIWSCIHNKSPIWLISVRESSAQAASKGRLLLNHLVVEIHNVFARVTVAVGFVNCLGLGMRTSHSM